MNSPSPHAYTPLFACDDRTFVDQFIARIAGLSASFFLGNEMSGGGAKAFVGRDDLLLPQSPECAG